MPQAKANLDEEIEEGTQKSLNSFVYSKARKIFMEMILIFNRNRRIAMEGKAVTWLPHTQESKSTNKVTVNKNQLGSEYIGRESRKSRSPFKHLASLNRKAVFQAEMLYQSVQ